MTDTRYTDVATGRECVRADAVEAQLAEARREALREAMEECTKLMRSLVHDMPAVEYTDVDTCIVLRDRISGLLDAEVPAQPKSSVQEAASDTENRVWLKAIEVVSKYRNACPPGIGFQQLNEVMGALDDERRAALRALAGGDTDD